MLYFCNVQKENYGKYSPRQFKKFLIFAGLPVGRKLIPTLNEGRYDII
ncbi:hypothetical protein A33Q_2635 [Indibacter alkaliphilus LW1]|uniref:Uncharacterized protein n=1 Tax=Indibacter alkaliphilus (strain CCUG 57479 / KCTC 22604 / LW1) TaxID=1189612 RepID=S2D9Z4_INDAL|nr:hypothetical protein A33Q_2635 [Indibacter alkaliphilus LW1]